HLRGGVRALGARLCQRRGRNPVPARARHHPRPILGGDPARDRTMSGPAKRGRLPLPALIGVTLGAIIMVTPLLWTLLLSFKGNAELMRDSMTAFSPPYTLENYRAILAGSSVSQWLLNSLIVSLGTTAGVLILCSLAGYGFARLDFPFRRTLFVFVLLGLAIPEQAVLLPRHHLFAV